MKRKIRLIVVNAAILAVLIVIEIIVIRTMTGGGSTAQVVFAKEPIGARTLITADMLELRRIDAKLAGDSYAGSIADAAGMRAAHDIEAGEILFRGSYRAGMPSNAIEFSDPEMRLFSLELKGDEANGWWIDAEQRADVIFVPASELVAARLNASGFSGGTIENVRIAAVLDEKGNRVSYSERAAPPRYVCLEVTTAQAEFLAFAKVNGRVGLAVRPDE